MRKERVHEVSWTRQAELPLAGPEGKSTVVLLIEVLSQDSFFGICPFAHPWCHGLGTSGQIRRAQECEEYVFASQGAAASSQSSQRPVLDDWSYAKDEEEESDQNEDAEHGTASSEGQAGSFSDGVVHIRNLKSVQELLDFAHSDRLPEQARSMQRLIGLNINGFHPKLAVLHFFDRYAGFNVRQYYYEHLQTPHGIVATLITPCFTTRGIRGVQNAPRIRPRSRHVCSS